MGAVAARRTGRGGGAEERRDVAAAGGDGVRGAGAAEAVTWAREMHLLYKISAGSFG